MIIFYGLLLAFSARFIFKSWLNPISLSYLMVSFQLVLGQIIRSLAYPLESSTELNFVYLLYGYCLICGYLLTSLISGGKIIGNSWGLLRSNSRKGVNLANLVILILGGITLFHLLSANVLSLFDIRRYYIESRQDGVFGALIFLIGLLGPIMFAVNISLNNKAWAAIILFIMLLTGKKAPLFTSILLFIVYIIDSNRLSKKTFLLALLGSIGIVILQVITTTSSLSAIKVLSGYFAYYNYASIVIENSPSYSDMYNLFEINFSRMWKLIPRIFYPDKPTLYGYNLVHSIVFPYEYGIGFTPGISSKITVPFFESGYLGVVVYGLINGIYTGFITLFAVANRNIIIKIVCIKLIITGFSLYTVVIVSTLIIISKINAKKSIN